MVTRIDDCLGLKGWFQVGSRLSVTSVCFRVKSNWVNEIFLLRYSVLRLLNMHVLLPPKICNHAAYIIACVGWVGWVGKDEFIPLHTLPSCALLDYNQHWSVQKESPASSRPAAPREMEALQVLRRVSAPLSVIHVNATLNKYFVIL